MSRTSGDRRIFAGFSRVGAQTSAVSRMFAAGGPRHTGSTPDWAVTGSAGAAEKCPCPSCHRLVDHRSVGQDGYSCRRRTQGCKDVDSPAQLVFGGVEGGRDHGQLPGMDGCAAVHPEGTATRTRSQFIACLSVAPSSARRSASPRASEHGGVTRDLGGALDACRGLEQRVHGVRSTCSLQRRRHVGRCAGLREADRHAHGYGGQVIHCPGCFERVDPHLHLGPHLGGLRRQPALEKTPGVTPEFRS